MSRFPKARRKPRPLSIFEQARRFYGEAFEVNTPRDLADAMADWSDLGAAERTFTLSHLLYLNLMALAGVQTLLHELLETVQDVADDLDDDDEGDEDADEEDDLEDDREPERKAPEVEDSEPEMVDTPPPGVTIPEPDPVVITPPVDQEDDGGEPEPGESDLEDGP